VLDLTSVVSGPLSTMFLADQGAEVIKIEPLGGDITRRSRQSISASGEFSALFVSTNRGKRSLALDLKRPEAAKIMRKLIASADVLVQNFRPGTMERLGLGEPTLRAFHPRLIYVSISGVGESGPYAGKRVYDPIIQGLSGFADVQADPETRRPRMIRTIVADKTTAIFAAQAVTAALFARERTGLGQHIRLAMLDTMIAYLWPEAMTQYTVVGREASTADPTARPELIFATRRLHHRRYHLRFRVARLLRCLGTSGSRRGSEVQHPRWPGGQRHRADSADGGDHQATPDRGLAATARHE